MLLRNRQNWSLFGMYSRHVGRKIPKNYNDLRHISGDNVVLKQYFCLTFGCRQGFPRN
jgi:hypothetical protein